MCKHCHGLMCIIWGLLLLVNAFLWPKWVDTTGWIAFGAILLTLSGIVVMVWPQCAQDKCGCACEVPKSAKKKRK